jgi:hypothetical protein
MPLILDPDGSMFTIINSWVHQKDSFCVSTISSSLESTLIQTAIEVKIAMIFDVTYLVPSIIALLPLDVINSDPANSKGIRILQKTVNIRQGFRMILFSPSSKVLDLPPELLTRVSIINTATSSFKAAKALFKELFLNRFNHGVVDRVIAARKVKITQKVNLIKYERETLGILSDIVATQQVKPEYDYLSDQETLQDLQKAKDSYLESFTRTQNQGEIPDEMKSSTKLFKPSIHIFGAFWKVMSRYLPSIDCSLCFNFGQYLKTINPIISADLAHSAILNAELHLQMQSSIISTSISYVSPSLTSAEMNCLLFLVLALPWKKDQNMIHKQVKEIIDHVERETRGLSEFCGKQ